MKPWRQRAVCACSFFATASSFCATPQHGSFSTRVYSDKDDWNVNNVDSDQWGNSPTEESVDWETDLESKNDGSFWSSFEPSKDDGKVKESTASEIEPDDQAESWLDIVQSLSAEEVEFNLKEADRADKVRQMQEWGFDQTAIANSLDVAVDASLEETTDIQEYLEESYLDEVDLATIESHKTVESDESGEPVRQQMVYVDEHTCIGCTNCAMIAQSTFFMHQEHGRARVFQQWGDDDETIAVAIATCPVDCIHYIPYDELVRLEKERRDQNINFKARLVSQAEYAGSGGLPKHGGGLAFTEPQRISGNMGARCSNCPSRGCKNCPMFGVGKNPEYERREAERLQKQERRKIQAEREKNSKSLDL